MRSCPPPPFTGERASSGPVKRIQGDHDDLFARGAVDTFRLRLPVLGALTEATLYHDNFGPNPAWRLDQVNVLDENTGECYFFPANLWISQEDGLSATMRVVTATRILCLPKPHSKALDAASHP